MSGFTFSDANMTTELCLSTCAGKGFIYAGTQYASECYCGNGGDSGLGATAAPETSCNMPCKGSASQIWYVSRISSLAKYTNLLVEDPVD